MVQMGVSGEVGCTPDAMQHEDPDSDPDPQ